MYAVYVYVTYWVAYPLIKQNCGFRLSRGETFIRPTQGNDRSAYKEIDKFLSIFSFARAFSTNCNPHRFLDGGRYRIQSFIYKENRHLFLTPSTGPALQ